MYYDDSGVRYRTVPLLLQIILKRSGESNCTSRSIGSRSRTISSNSFLRREKHDRERDTVVFKGGTNLLLNGIVVSVLYGGSGLIAAGELSAGNEMMSHL